MLHITRHRTVFPRRESEVRKAKILIVDDDPQIRRRLRLGMSGQGYIVDGAKSGAEALDQLHTLQPDLVLLEIEMPGIDGIETSRMIRATSDAGAIMLTAKKSVEDQIAAFDAGAGDFVSKPALRL
jgi:DNA-binding response OmpR family regulator